jgi:hypothetical protein
MLRLKGMYLPQIWNTPLLYMNILFDLAWYTLQMDIPLRLGPLPLYSCLRYLCPIDE